MLEIKNTSSINNKHINLMIYGHSGVGKTHLISTLDKPFVIDTERGLLTLSGDIGNDISYAEIFNTKDLEEVYKYFAHDESARAHRTIVIDSLTELGELILEPLKRVSKDPRQAYGAMQDEINGILRMFRDLPYNICYIAQTDMIKDESGALLYSPALPGDKLKQKLPHKFDEVLAFRIHKKTDEKGVITKTRYIQTESDGQWLAKDRSRNLSNFEKPNLQNIINKCLKIKSNDIKELENVEENKIQNMELSGQENDIA